MTFFFLVVGLEARREFDLGDLRERRRFVLPLAAGLVGMAVPVADLPGVQRRPRRARTAWGVAMSTDTALALGLLALLGRDVPDRVRVFLLTVFVVDDLAALLVIALVYSDDIVVLPLVLAVAAFVAAAASRCGSGCSSAGCYVALGVRHVGGVAGQRHRPRRGRPGHRAGGTGVLADPGDLEEATGLVRRFREEPTPELARSATVGLRLDAVAQRSAADLLPPVDELRDRPAVRARQRRHRRSTRDFLAERLQPRRSPSASSSGYVVGKPVAVVGGPPGWSPGSAAAGSARPSAGPRCSAAAPSPASASRSRC